jgi:hypothetical protein
MLLVSEKNRILKLGQLGTDLRASEAWTLDSQVIWKTRNKLEMSTTGYHCARGSCRKYGRLGWSQPGGQHCIMLPWSACPEGAGSKLEPTLTTCQHLLAFQPSKI